MTGPETNPKTITLITMRLGNTCLGIGDLRMTVPESFLGTITQDGMMPIRISNNGEMIAGGQEGSQHPQEYANQELVLANSREEARKAYARQV